MSPMDVFSHLFKHPRKKKKTKEADKLPTGQKDKDTMRYMAVYEATPVRSG